MTNDERARLEDKRLIEIVVLLLKIGAAIGAYRYLQLHPDLRRLVFMWGAVASTVAVIAGWPASLKLRGSRKGSSRHWMYLCLAFVTYFVGQAIVGSVDVYPPQSVVANTPIDGLVVGIYSCAYGLLAFSFSLQLFQLVLRVPAQRKRTAPTQWKGASQ